MRTWEVTAVAKIPEEVLTKVRESVDIGDVIGQYVNLKQSGKNLTGLCPFHQERTPSFTVNEKGQFYYCFGCHRGGNVIKFLMEYKHIDFIDAVKEVAALGNIDLPRQYTSQPEQRAVKPTGPRADLLKMHNEAAALYHHLLVSTAAGKPAMNYLQQRGTKREMIDQFNLGFAPDEEILKPYFTKKQVDYQLLRKSGLFTEDSKGELHDRFRGRVMFPLLDANGHVVGFSGRVLDTTDKSIPKYLNSPETELFNKRRNLFNFNVARKSARKDGKIYLFEGFMDVISAFSAGVTNGVASMGTSLTSEQVRILSRATNQLDVCYDGDEPGQNAINRALDLIKENAGSKLTIRVVQLPAGIDPDEFVQQRGEEKFRQYLSDSEETSVDFKLRFLRHDVNLSNQAEKAHYLQEAVKIVAQIDNQLTRDVYVNQLAKEFDVDASVLQSQIRPILRQRQARQTNVVDDDSASMDVDDSPLPPPPSDPEGGQGATAVVSSPSSQPTFVDRTELAEQTLLHYMLQDPEIWDYVGSHEGFAFIHEKYQTLYLLAQGYLESHEEYSTADFMDFLDDDELKNLIGQIDAMRIDDDPPRSVIDDCIKELMNRAPLDNKIAKLKAEINEAQSLNDDDQVTKLTTELVTLIQQQEKMKAEGEIN